MIAVCRCGHLGRKNIVQRGWKDKMLIILPESVFNTFVFQTEEGKNVEKGPNFSL